MRAHLSHSRGFTLIELLVVIAIIGLLSAVILASLNVARARGNDAKRMADLHELQDALAIYYSDNGAYPANPGQYWGVCSGFGSHATSGSNGWIPNLAPTYISVLPTDPKPTNTNTCYLYHSDGKDYIILAYGTVESYTPSTNPEPRPLRPTEADFAVYTPGGEYW